MSLPTIQCGHCKNMTATGNVTPGAAQLIGFYVHSSAGGTLLLKDGGASGTALSGTFAPEPGFHPYPAIVGNQLHATIDATNGELDLTFFYANAH